MFARSPTQDLTSIDSATVISRVSKLINILVLDVLTTVIGTTFIAILIFFFVYVGLLLGLLNKEVNNDLLQ